MGEDAKRDFLARYEGRKSESFDNRRMLERYGQYDVTVLRLACQVFSHEFMPMGNIEVFLESIREAWACDKKLRKRFLQTDTIGLIPTGRHNCNKKYSKKALMWLLLMEQADGVKIMHGRNGRD